MAVRDVAVVPCRSALEHVAEMNIHWVANGCATPNPKASPSTKPACTDRACLERRAPTLSPIPRDVSLCRLPIPLEGTRLPLDGPGQGPEAARKADQEDGCQGTTPERQSEPHLRFD